MKSPLVWLMALMLLAGCASNGRYSQRHDSAPHRLPDKISLHDAVPKAEKVYPASLRPYQVMGKTYRPMTVQQARNYSATGQASWYGQKFHGHQTANGETYNMYQMTAAHKTLPLPTYARITNLDNNKQAIVKINDRGPFHGHRLLDMSYAAAKKLGMLKTGVANIRLDVITLTADGQLLVAGKPMAPAPKPKGVYVQVTALQDSDKVNQMAKGLAVLYQVPTYIPEQDGLYRLQLGPLSSEKAADDLLKQIRQSGYPHAFTVNAAD